MRAPQETGCFRQLGKKRAATAAAGAGRCAGLQELLDATRPYPAHLEVTLEGGNVEGRVAEVARVIHVQLAFLDHVDGTCHPTEVGCVPAPKRTTNVWAQVHLAVNAGLKR